MSGIGHLAAGFAAKPLEPQIPIWALLLAAETNDILYGIFSTIGLEPKVSTTMNFREGVRYASTAINPLTHGLFMSIVWSVTAALIGWLIFKNWHHGLILGAVVFSHWILDFLMHSNLPLFFNGSPLLGIGLENSGPGFIFITVLDLVILAAGVVYYLSYRKKSAKAKPM